MISLRLSKIASILLTVAAASALLIACTNPASPTTSTTSTPPTASSADDLTAFSIVSPAVTGTISGSNITVTAPWYATDLSSLVVDFTVSAGATVTVNGTTQASGTTANDFSSPVTYTVTAADGTTTKSYTVTVSTAALTWTNAKLDNSISTEWTGNFFLSSDGTIATGIVNGGDIYRGVESGGSWTWTDETASPAPGSGAGWNWIAGSSDGSRMVALDDTGGDVWTWQSTASGGSGTWTKQSSTNDPSAPTGLTSGAEEVAMSSTGSDVAVVNNAGNVYVSTDYGNGNWTTLNLSSVANFDSVFTSADGSRMALASEDTTTGDSYVSSGDPTSSASWSAVTNTPPSDSAGDLGYGLVAGSSDGKVLYFSIPFNADIYRVTLSGTSWIWTNLTAALDATSSGPPSWSAIACSSDGNVLIATEDSSHSSQAGDIWAWVSPSVGGSGKLHDLTPTGAESAQSWNAVAISADGSEIAAYDGSVNVGGLFIGK